MVIQVNKVKQRNDALDGAIKEIDKKILDNTVTIFTDVCEAKKVHKASPFARGADFFTRLRKVLGDWDKTEEESLL